MTTSDREPIAVVGIGCRFPGGVSTAKQFWETLQNGTEVVGDVPKDRFDASSFYSRDPQKNGTIRNNKGGFLDDVKSFDAEFFGYYPAEASRIDPHQRLALEASVHALQDSGTPLDGIAGSRTSVILGTFMYDHFAIQSAAGQRDDISPHVAMGSSICSTANRVSHRLNLQGPSITLDTACSSSLTALHLACQSLWAQESEGALAGGVNVILRPETTIMLSKGGFLSPDGSCRPFDASANGYVRSEGVGVVYLKPLSKAIRDMDRIYACVRDSLVNQDGYTAEGYTVPSLAAQSRLLENIYARSNTDPRNVQYVEAHGPGTTVGDPIEATALGEQLARTRNEDKPLWIASVKGNYGHLEGAAGIIAFIKACLVTFHGIIPPQPNHATPNPSIDFKSLRLAVANKKVLLPCDPERKRLVGVNSFGAGGTNAHTILEEAPNDTSRYLGGSHNEARVFHLSARSQSALAQLARDLAAYLRLQKPSLQDVAYTLNVRRDQYSPIAVIPANSPEELCERLDKLGSQQQSKDILTLQKLSNTNPRVAFVFPGQGGQWLGMGLRLANQEPVFRDHLAAFDEIFQSIAKYSIVAEIVGYPKDPDRLNETTITQPAIAAIQIALARTLMSYGLIPDSCVGHSVGEIMAAHICGALTLEEAVKVIYFRSQLQSKAAGEGSMLATGISGTDAEQMIQRLQVAEGVEIAAFNGRKMTTLTGVTRDLERVASELDERGVFARFVKIDTPYHSRFMDAMEDEMLEILAPIEGKPVKMNLYSSLTTTTEPGTHLTPKYWFDNMRWPVRYVETASRMIEDGLNFFVEIGPHPILVSATKDIADTAKRPIHMLPGMVRDSDLDSFARVIGGAHAVGIPVDISSLNGDGGRLIDLPLYPFQRQSYWFEHPECQRTRVAESRHPFLGDLTSLADDGRGMLRLRLSTGVSPFLADHVADGAIVFPMTGHIEAAYLAASKYQSHRMAWLDDIRFEQPVVLASAQDFAPQVMLEITSPANDFVLSTRAATANPKSTWQVCSRGRINVRDRPPMPEAEGLDMVKARLQSGTEVDIDAFYRKLEEAGLRYGDAFRCVQNISHLGAELISMVKLPSILEEEAAQFKFHPVLLDACVHTAFAYQHHVGDPSQVYLPSHVGSVVLVNDHSIETAFAHVQVYCLDDTFLKCNVSVYEQNGDLIAMLTGMTAKRLQSKPLSRPMEHEVRFQPEAEEQVQKVEMDFENVLILNPLGERPSWVKGVAQEAFPHSRIHDKLLEEAKGSLDARQCGFNLDRRMLLIIPVLFSGPPEDCLPGQLDGVITALIHVASWIHDQNGSCMVAVLTEGGCVTPEDTHCDPLAVSIEAAIRVMANELPQAIIRMIDIGLDAAQYKSSQLVAELRTMRVGRKESVVALRSGSRFVRRIVPIDVQQEETQGQKLSMSARGGNYVAKPNQNGSLDNVVIERQPVPKVGPEEVAIDVHAAGLNFKDVMNAMGLLGDRAASGGLTGRNLGLEVAGRAVDIGENVTGIQHGASVMARVSNGITGLAVASRDLVVPIPSSLSVTQAASVQIAFFTAYYALVHLGRLTAGESILVHSGAGGVGIAAIQIAKLVGARAYATAGTPARRAWVASMGAEAVFDSRAVTFHEELKAANHGQGVNVVLNCLTGALLSQSVACLEPFGRFLEIGKTDVYRNTRLGLEQLGQNCSFSVIDIDRLAAQKPSLHRWVVNEVCQLFNDGKLVPPPITTYPVTELSAALKELSRGSVIGKAAVEMPDNEKVQARYQSRLSLEGDRSYLLTGGTSGLGLYLAKLLAERGARHLVLVSRSGPKSAEDHTILSDLRGQKITINIEHGDVADAQTVNSLFHHKKPWPPIAGVIHCAGVLSTESAHGITIDGFRTVFCPKALGAWNLHEATKGLDLEFFTLISSVSSVLGIAGHFAYATANQFLDGLAHHRRLSGLPGTSINFGGLGDYAGMSRRSGGSNRIVDMAQSEGLSGSSLPEATSALERALIYDTIQVTVANIDWSMFLKAYPHLTIDGAYFGLDKQQMRDGGAESKKLLSQLSGAERSQVITDTLQSGLAKILGVDASRISPTEKIDQYSFDSLTLTQVRGMILREFRVPYPLIKLYEGPSLQDIATELESISDESQSGTGGANDSLDSSSGSAAYDGLTKLSSWFVRGSAANSDCPRLLCFHAMGTGASLFTPFLMDPPEGLDPIAVQLPGRETRADEPMVVSMPKIVTSILDEMESEVGIPHIMWGHSFGGLIAFEVMRGLRERGIGPLPKLVVSGTIAPHLVGIWQKRDTMIEILREDVNPEYLLAVARYVDDADFVRSILPNLRKDIPMLLEYQPREDKVLDTTITAFAARQDDIVYPEEIAAWQTHAKEFRQIEVEGDHWFLYRNRRLLRETLADMACVAN